MSQLPKPTWPEGKRFAFTVFDDTDRATLENNRAIYDFLDSVGLKTTKSVWAFDGDAPPYIPGITCDDLAYVDWLQDLQKRDFEIAWHLATWETSSRERTERGLNRFRELFGADPTSMANHASNEEGIYWGSSRIGGLAGALARFTRSKTPFSGHVETSPLFWGDLCKERIRYVRNFVFSDINSLKMCPEMPYHDPEKPWVNQWFASSSAADVGEFNQLLDEKNVDRLQEEGGACIVYTHFGKGFYQDDNLDLTFQQRVSDLAAREGWFVPVTELLDFLAAQKQSPTELTPTQRRSLEYRWIADRFRNALAR